MQYSFEYYIAIQRQSGNDEFCAEELEPPSTPSRFDCGVVAEVTSTICNVLYDPDVSDNTPEQNIDW